MLQATDCGAGAVCAGCVGASEVRITGAVGVWSVSGMGSIGVGCGAKCSSSLILGISEASGEALIPAMAPLTPAISAIVAISGCSGPAISACSSAVITV